METETLDAYILDLLADEEAMATMGHMEDSGYADEEDAVMALACRIDTTGLMEETLANLPPEVLTMSWHRAVGGLQWVSAQVMQGDSPRFYPYEEFLKPCRSVQELHALDRWIKNRDLALPDGDCITVTR